MQALAIAGLGVALALAGPSLWRLAANTDPRPPFENAAPAPPVSSPAQAEIAPVETPATVVTPPPVSEPAGPVNDAIVAPVKRSQPKTPPIAQDNPADTDKAEPKAKSSSSGGKTVKSATPKKPVKKARVTRAEPRTK